MPMRLLTMLLFLFTIPLNVTAHEPTLHRITSTHMAQLHSGEQVVAAATCPPGTAVLSGGYKLLKSSVTMRTLVVVENRPVPESDEWLVALLYDPAPRDIQNGTITFDVSAVCRAASREAAPQTSRRGL